MEEWKNSICMEVATLRDEGERLESAAATSIIRDCTTRILRTIGGVVAAPAAMVDEVEKLRAENESLDLRLETAERALERAAGVHARLAATEEELERAYASLTFLRARAKREKERADALEDQMRRWRKS